MRNDFYRLVELDQTIPLRYAVVQHKMSGNDKPELIAMFKDQDAAVKYVQEYNNA